MSIAMTSPTETARADLAERCRVLRLLREHEAALRALGVERLWLFGSLARGRARSGSDVDVVIAIVPGRKLSLFDLAEVRAELSERLGRDTDVVIEEDLQPGFRRDIARDLIEIF